MVALISPMGLILGSWFLLFLMFSGLGFIVQRVVKQPMNTGSLWLDAFWLGWALSLLILQFWHFAFPVNDIIFVLFLLIAGISFLAQRHQLLVIVRRFKQYRLFIVIFGVVLLWMANRAIDMPTAFDTGFRDMQAVMWVDTYPIVPGLNNLFSSLAFNQSVYLYDALLDVSIWSNRAYYIATGLLMTVFLASAIWGAIQLFRHRKGRGIRWSWILLTSLIPYMLFDTILPGAITHFLTDTAVDLIGFVCVAYVLDFLQFYQVERSDNDYVIYKIAFLILTGFTLKQSFIVFGLGLGVLVFIIWLRRGGLRIDSRRSLRLVALVMGYALVLGIPFMARGVITSGYVAYPQSFGRFDVDWAEAPELVKERQEMLATNTRLRYGDPEEVLSSWNWLIPWFQSNIKQLFEFTVPIGLTFGMLVLYLLGRLRYRKEKQDQLIGLWVLIPMWVMVLIWFLSAPNIKYIEYVLWIQAAVMMILAMLAWYQIAWQRRVYVVFGVMGLGLLYVGYMIVALQACPLQAGPDNGFYERPMPPIKVVITQSGDEIYTPDSHIKQCWNIPLPCTPVPHTRIFERVPGDIRHGFGLLPKDAQDSD